MISDRSTLSVGVKGNSSAGSGIFDSLQGRWFLIIVFPFLPYLPSFSCLLFFFFLFLLSTQNVNTPPSPQAHILSISSLCHSDASYSRVISPHVHRYAAGVLQSWSHITTIRTNHENVFKNQSNSLNLRPFPSPRNPREEDNKADPKIPRARQEGTKRV